MIGDTWKDRSGFIGVEIKRDKGCVLLDYKGSPYGTPQWRLEKSLKKQEKQEEPEKTVVRIRRFDLWLEDRVLEALGYGQR